MSKEKAPVTAAIRELRAHKVDFTDHLYEYEEKGGTAVSARELGVPEHAVVKTLVMEDEDRNPLVALMHGDLNVSTKELARIIGVKTIAPCNPDKDRHIFARAERRGAADHVTGMTWKKLSSDCRRFT